MNDLTHLPLAGHVRGSPTPQALHRRAMERHHRAQAVCACGEVLYRARVRDAKAQPSTTDALIRQAIRDHGKACERASEAGIRFVPVVGGANAVPAEIVEGTPEEVARHERMMSRATRNA